MTKNQYNVIGVMSGTSLDGIDVLHAHFLYDGVWRYKLYAAETYSYSKHWKLELKSLVDKSVAEINKIDHLYTAYLASKIKHFIKKHKIDAIDFVASHGHTALHQPEDSLTYQIGNLQHLADILHQNVVCDFRVQDVKLGGQGAPLVPIGDRLLFSNYEYCLNLGGFANVSFETNNERIAFDICPVNIVLNHYVTTLDLAYDDAGKIASTGTINEALLEALNALDYYTLVPPKSLGLEWVQSKVLPIINGFNIEIKAVLRTVVEHIALQISKVITNANTSVLVTGGGAYNTFLMTRLKALCLSNIQLPDKELIEFKEALIFGFLGVLKVRNEINCLKSVTGATQNHASGKFLFPNSKINV